MSEQNREKEERLFRALSGVEEELLHRSEQNEGVEKRKANGKIRRFPLYYVSRIAAACLCFVAMGAVFVTVRNSSKMADSTSNDAAAPQPAYSAGAEKCGTGGKFCSGAGRECRRRGGDGRSDRRYAGRCCDGGDGSRGWRCYRESQAAQTDSMDEKQRSQPDVSGNEASGAEDSMEEAEQDREETLKEKQKSPSLEKMKTKGQQ